MTLSAPQVDTLVRILTITTPLAMLFSGFIVLSFLKFESLRSRSYQLLFTLACADFIYSFSTVFNQDPVSGSALCTFQAMLIVFIATSTLVYTVLISVVLDMVVVRQIEPIPLWASITIATTLATILCILPLLGHAYGLAGSFCWIPAVGLVNGRLDPGTIWRWSIGYIPAVLCMILVMFFYARVAFVVRRFMTISSGGSPRLVRLVRQLRLYPIVLIFAWAPTIGLRFAQIVVPSLGSNYPYNITVACLRVAFLQPLFNAIVYGFNDAVFSAWSNYFEEQRDKPLFAKIGAFFSVTASPVAAIRESVDDISRAAIASPEPPSRSSELTLPSSLSSSSPSSSSSSSYQTTESKNKNPILSSDRFSDLRQSRMSSYVSCEITPEP